MRAAITVVFPVPAPATIMLGSSGDLIALRKVSDTTFYIYGNIYLIGTDNQILLRYVKPGSKPHSINLMTENPKWDPIELPYKSIRSAHLVVSIIKRQVN